MSLLDFKRLNSTSSFSASVASIRSHNARLECNNFETIGQPVGFDLSFGSKRKDKRESNIERLISSASPSMFTTPTISESLSNTTDLHFRSDFTFQAGFTASSSPEGGFKSLQTLPHPRQNISNGATHVQHSNRSIQHIL
ncbi:ATP-dependent zinc metalloprotease FTSH, chloroplastic [Gossypium australe]|uniref:ATP-dependent zinc metalloprotease FTSH, chloroplastic n=1 Tax=Gossypium australe TaxID=47621 RepID=A0A5B6VDF9_9ROSI|nr:ATP-dependent zinc metalloprotease FTSH, chloroplastic [Gossypium australe]